MDCFGKGKAHMYEIKVKVCYIDGLLIGKGKALANLQNPKMGMNIGCYSRDVCFEYYRLYTNAGRDIIAS